MKFQRLAKSFLGMTLAATMMAGCGTTGTGTSTGSTTTTTTTTTTTSTDAGSGTTETAPAPANGAKVGVSMPTKDLQRWNQDGANMESQLKAAGYEVDLQYAANDVQQQLSQIENMISNGCDVLVIAAIEGSSLGEALDMAKGANIPVIAYDRLIMNSDAVSYYATFDNYKVGTVQGTYVKDTLDLDNAAGPFNIEFTAGDPGDNNAGYFFNSAYDVLKDYIASCLPSMQTEPTLMYGCAPTTPPLLV